MGLPEGICPVHEEAFGRIRDQIEHVHVHVVEMSGKLDVLLPIVQEVQTQQRIVSWCAKRLFPVILVLGGSGYGAYRLVAGVI